MTTGPGEPEPSAPRERYKLPRILGVVAGRIRHEQPQPRNFASRLPAEGEAAEFLVETDSPIPIRALGPALHVGASVLVEVTALDATHYRFLDFNLQLLEPGTSISLGWSGQNEAERPTGFRFEGWDSQPPVSGEDG